MVVNEIVSLINDNISNLNKVIEYGKGNWPNVREYVEALVVELETIMENEYVQQTSSLKVDVHNAMATCKQWLMQCNVEDTNKKLSNKFSAEDIRLFERLNRELIILKEMFELLADNIECGINVKLPTITDIDEFAESINRLNKFVKLCPYFDTEEGRLQVHNVAKGSLWISFAIASGSMIILSNVAKLVSQVVQIRNEEIRRKKDLEALKKSINQNELMERIINDYTEATKLRKQIIAKELMDVDCSEEEIVRMLKAIDQLEKLMDKGMEIYASLGAPDEIQKQFPRKDIQSISLEDVKILAEIQNGKK